MMAMGGFSGFSRFQYDLDVSCAFFRPRPFCLFNMRFNNIRRVGINYEGICHLQNQAQLCNFIQVNNR
jgi:hypothetical protein